MLSYPNPGQFKGQNYSVFTLHSGSCVPLAPLRHYCIDASGTALEHQVEVLNFPVFKLATASGPDSESTRVVNAGAASG